MAETPLEGRMEPAARALSFAQALGSALTWLVPLALILLAGAALRFHGLMWDRASGAETSQHQHPDERFLSITASHVDWPDSLGEYFDTAQSPLNPYNDPETHAFVYGTFPFFLVKAVATMAGDDPAGGFDADSYDGTTVWGRRVTAGFDTATVLLVFAIGALLFGRPAGLASALLYALAVLPTQLAHFWTVDPYLTFFGAATLLLSVLLARARGLVWPWVIAAAIGVTLGLAVACKLNGLLFLAAPLAVCLFRSAGGLLPRLGLILPGPERKPQNHWLSEISLFCLIVATGVVTFRIAQPYAFAGPHFWDMALNPIWKADIKREWNFQNGDAGYPPFIQFAGRTPLLTPLRNLILFGLGPALGLAACLSTVAAGVQLFRRRDLRYALPLTIVVPVFLFQGSRFIAFMRYLEPIYPALCLLAGWGLVAFWRQANDGRLARLPLARRLPSGERAGRWAAAAAVAVVIGATAWWALAFQEVYREEHSRIQASRWIYENVPRGAAITYEYWDDPVPLALPEHPDASYRIIQTEPYESDSAAKIDRLVWGYGVAEAAGGLNAADYVAITSNRIRDSVRRLERTYPATIRYYDLLESGALGFERVATFTVHPTFLGLSVDDSQAEESFSVYDHPEVRLYRKTPAWDPSRAVALLLEAHPERAVPLVPRQGRSNGLQFTAEEATKQQSGGTFRAVFDPDGWASHLPWLWWLLWLEVAALASLPWVTLLFRALPDRGYGLTKLVGFVAVGLATWMAVAWGLADFSGGLAWSVFAVFLAAGAALGWLRRRTLAADMRERWPSWLALEAAFLVAFFAFLALRAFNPDLWHGFQGGEKPMEIAYLTAVTRSTEMPPYDPWFGGGSMNYYYMGWFLLAVPIRAFRLIPEIAFNLGVPTYAALTVSVAASTVHNLVALARGASRRPVSGGWARPAILAGLVGAVLLAGIGNLDGGHQLIQRLQMVNEWGLFQGVPVLGGVVGVAGGAFRWLFEGASLPPFDWWRPSRVHFGQIDITEFPYWTFLFADLHPHLMGLPVFGLTIALGMTYVASAAAGLRRHGWALGAAMGVVLGLERTVHTWDFPTAVIVVVGAVTAGQLLGSGRWQTRFWLAVGHLALAAAVLTVAFAPYSAHFETFEPGLARAQETTRPDHYFAQFGLFVGIAVLFLAVRYQEELGGRVAGARRGAFASWDDWLVWVALAVFTTGLAVFSWRYGLTVVALSALMDLLLLNLLWIEVRAQERDLGRMFATAFYALAFAIAAGVDVVTVQPDIERMNTVFKFGLQAWQLFALASGFAAWYAARALWQAHSWRIRPLPRRRAAAWTAAGVCGVLLLGSLVFVWSGTAARQNTRFAALAPTLDGLAYLNAARYAETKDTWDDRSDDVTIALEEDEPLIRWLRANVDGSPIIVEAVGPLYSWTGRIANNTGLPAVIGWEWHQVQQRTDYELLVHQRRSDTEQFFSNPSTPLAEEYLRRYNVSYVVVGSEERVYGTPAGLAKFPKMAALSEVFRSGESVIYRVDQSKIALPGH